MQHHPDRQLRRRARCGGVIRKLTFATAVAMAMASAWAADDTIDWRVIAGGGTTDTSGGGYTLAGTIGQPVAGLAAGGGYTLDAGFWQSMPAAISGGPIFNDGFED